MLRQVTRASHVYSIELKTANAEQWIFACPDIHWDNPKCNRELLKRHLDEAVKMNARIIMPGDTFCLMQGAYDPRKNKSDIRPEHNVSNYLDAVISDAAEWFKPYRDNIDIVGLGNHETNILKRLESDPVERFVTLLNAGAKGHHVMAGGYGGWYTVRFTRNKTSRSWVMKYHHGSGGAAPVTKGTIQHNRQAVQTEGADCMVMGHVHNDYEMTYTREMLDEQWKPITRDLMMVRCSTYKDEFNDGHRGWHNENGMGPRPLGGRFICLNFRRGHSTPYVAPTLTAYSRRAV